MRLQQNYFKQIIQYYELDIHSTKSWSYYFINEKKAIKDFTFNKLNELKEKPEGIKYLMRIHTSLSSLIINDEKTGPELVNTVVNNIPFQLPASGCNFLGSGTKLNKRNRRY